MFNKSNLYHSFKNDFHRYYQPLCQYANAFLEDMPSAEDIVQDIFLKVWERKQDLIGKAELKFYLYIAVRNNCLNRIRERTKLPIEKEEIDWSKISVPDERTVMASIDAGSVIREALNRLPARCREIFILSRVSQLTYQRIADAMGISVKTVENQMGKAIKILKSYGQEKSDLILMLLIYFRIIIDS